MTTISTRQNFLFICIAIQMSFFFPRGETAKFSRQNIYFVDKQCFPIKRKGKCC